MNPKINPFIFLLAVCIMIASCGSGTTEPVITDSVNTPIDLPTTFPDPTPPSFPSQSNYYFSAGGEPFRFVGSWYPAWQFESEWDEAAQVDLIESAREMGITVLHVMLPSSLESSIGTFNETELQKLDFLLDTASRNNIYVMISFIHATAIVEPGWEHTTYSNPSGIDGIIFNETLAQGFRNRIKFLIERTNSINGKVYRDDPTIMSWLVCDEPVAVDFWYPSGIPPKVTLSQLTDWIASTATYIKSLDPNHLVTIYLTSGVNSIKGADGTDWGQILDIPSIDFIFIEDADMRIVEKSWPSSDYPYSAEIFNHNKPIIINPHLSYGILDVQTGMITNLCQDYAWQAETMKVIFRRYFEEGISGVVLSTWGSDLYSPNINMPEKDRCMLYTDSNQPAIDQILIETTQLYNPSTLPISPMPFITIGNPITGTTTLSSSSTLEPSWMYRGPDGQSITSLAINPRATSIIYAGTFGTNSRVLKTTNSGAEWEASNNTLSVPDIRSLAIDPTKPTTIYAGTNNGIYKSTNNGKDWSELSRGMIVFSLAIDVTSPETLYAGTDFGVFKSTDGGLNWQPINNGLATEYIQTIVIDPQTPSTLYAGTYNGIFKSMDGGQNWEAASAGLSGTWVYALAIDPSTPTTIFAGTFDGVFKSINGGQNWNAMNNGLSNLIVQVIVVDPENPATLFAGTYGGVFVSTDSGESWNPMNNGLTIPKIYVLALASTIPTTLYAGTSNGVFSIELTNP